MMVLPCKKNSVAPDDSICSGPPQERSEWHGVCIKFASLNNPNSYSLVS